MAHINHRPDAQMRNRISAALCALLLTGLAFATPPKVVEQFTGKVIGISDGDTITVLVDKASVKVRLEAIDAPESGQRFGQKSKQALATLVAGKTVTVEKTGTERYGGTLAFIRAEKVDVNARMIADGWAWHFKRYSDDETLAKLEVEAREAKRGLWADAAPLAPWEYRARKKMPETPTSATGGDAAKSHWLNNSSNVRHNQRCEHYGKTKRGRYCGSSEGKACGICGG